MPTLPANNSNTFPKKIHFAVIGQLTPADVRNIIIWKKYNPDYEVTLHRDPQSYLDQLKLQKMSEVALRIDELVRINKGLPSGSSGLQATVAWYELKSELKDRIKSLRLQQGDMEVTVQGECRNLNTDRQTALKKELRSSYNVDSKYIKKILRQQSDLEKALLSQGVNVADFDDTLPNTTALVTAQRYRDLYDQIAYIYNDFDLALKIMKNRILDQHGGLMIDTAVTPEINTDIFDGSSSLNYQQLIDDLKQRHSITAPSGASPLPDPDSIIRNHVHQAFIRKLKIDPGRSNRWFNTPYRNYLATLKRSGFEELAKAIKEVTKKNSPKLFYKGLGGALPTHGADLSMVDNSRGLNASPPIIAARQNALALKKTIDFFAQIYSTFKHNSSDGKLKRDLPKLATSLTTHTLKNLPAPKRTARIEQIKKVVNQLPYRGIYFSTDNLGYLMGREAMVMMNTVTPPLDVEYSYHADGGRSIQGVDLAAETYLTKTDQYDNRVIVTLSEDSGIWQGDAELYQRHPGNTYWAFWDRHQKLLLTQAGQPLPLTESSKLVLSGHGGSTGLENHSPDEVADIVSKLLPAGGQIKKINLLCCKLDQIFINVDPGPNLASQQWLSKTFSGRLLESLARKQNSITVGSVTFFNKSSSKSTFLGKSFAYAFGQTEPPLTTNPLTAYYKKQSHQISLRKPEATVVEMQRAADGTFTARTKNGVPLFDDYVEKKKLIRVTPTNPHPGNLASPSAILSISQATNLLPYINNGNVIAPADLNIILFIFNRNISFSNKVIAVDSGPKAEGLAFTLKAAKEARNYDEWMAKISEYYPNENAFFSRMLAMEYTNNSERDSKFAKLQGLVRDDKIVVITADLPNELDLVTGQYDQKNIAYSLIPLPNSCNIASSRRRRSVSTSNCNWDFDKATDRLKLVAGDRIDFLLPDGTATEIGLFKPQNKKLAELQTAIQGYRRRTAITDLANRFGQHTVIALDDASFSVARKMVEKLRGKLDRYIKNSIKVFLANLDRNVLVSARGMVTTMISGGAANKITLIGNKDSLSGTKPESVIRTFTSEQRVGWLQIAALGQTENTLLNRFNEGRLNTLKSLSHVQIFSALPSGQLPKDDDVAKLSRQGPGGTLVTSGFLSGQAELPLSGVYSQDSQASPLLSASDKTLERALFDSLQVQEALEVDRTSLHLDNIEKRLQPVYRRLGMEADYIPLLGSLSKVTGSGKPYWTLAFYHADTRQLKTVRLPDLRLVDSIKSINAQIDRMKKALGNQQKNRNLRQFGLHSERFSDGAGVLMSLATLIYQGVNQSKAGALDMSSLSSSQRKLLEAQMYFGIVAEAFEIADLSLTIGKYAVALKTGKALSVSDRMLSSIEKSTARALRAGKKSLMLPLGAKFIKAAGPGMNLVFSGVSLGLSVSQLQDCKTSKCKVGSELAIFTDSVMLATTVVAIAAKLAAGLIGVAAASLISGAGALVGIAVAVVSVIYLILSSSDDTPHNPTVFKNNMALWDYFFNDLTMKDAWDAKTKKLNLLSKVVEEVTEEEVWVTRRKCFRAGKDTQCNDVPVKVTRTNRKNVDVSRLAPITELDLENRSVKYGAINVADIRNRRAYWSNEPKNYPQFNILSAEKVKTYLSENLALPKSDVKIKNIVLPRGGDITLKKWSNPLYIAETVDSTGWRLLKSANKPGARVNFAVARKGGSTSWMLPDLKEPIEKFTPRKQVTVIPDKYDQTFHDVDKLVNYSFHQPTSATDDYTYSITVPADGKLTINYHPTRRNHVWNIILKDDPNYTSVRTADFTTRARGTIELNVSVPPKKEASAGDKTTTGSYSFVGCTAGSRGANQKPLAVIIDRENYRRYILDRKTCQIKIVYMSRDVDESHIKALEKAYRTPPHEAYEPPNRLIKTSSGKWIDLSGEAVEGGKCSKMGTPEEVCEILYNSTDHPEHFKSYDDRAQSFIGDLTVIEHFTFERWSGSSGRNLKILSKKISTIPDDIDILSGRQTKGYLLISRKEKALYYQQSISNKGKVKALLQIPGKYTGYVVADADNNEVYLQSQYGPRYHVTINKGTFLNKRVDVPKLEPALINWQNENYAESLLDLYEIHAFNRKHSKVPTSVHQVIPGALTPELKHLTSFYAAYAGQHYAGRIAVWNPDREQFIYGKNGFEFLKINSESKQLLTFTTTEKGSFQPFYTKYHCGIRSSANKGDWYLLLRTKEAKGYVGDIYFLKAPCQESTQKWVPTLSAVTPTHHPLYIRQLNGNKIKLSLVAAAVDRESKTLIIKTQSRLTYHLSSSVLKQLLSNQGGDIIINQSNTGIATLNIPRKNFTEDPVAEDNNVKTLFAASGLKQEELDELLPSVLKVNNYKAMDYQRWYIKDLKKVYEFKASSNLFGYDRESETVYYYEPDSRFIRTVTLNSQSKRRWKESEGTNFGNDLYDYKQLSFNWGKVFGTDASGRTFYLEKQSRTLLELGFQKEPALVNSQVRTITSLTEELDKAIWPKVRSIVKQRHTLTDPVIKLNLPDSWSGFQAWYQTEATLAKKMGIYVFFGDKPVTLLGNQREFNWYATTDGKELYRQKGNGQSLMGRFGYIAATGDGRSLTLFGTPDDNDFPQIRLGSAGENTLILNGKGGNDRYTIDSQTLNHYASIIIDNTVTHYGQNDTTLGVATVNINLPAYRFSAEPGEQSLILADAKSGHKLYFTDHYNWKVLDRGNQTGTAPFEFKSAGTQIRFNGLTTSLQNIVDHSLQQPGRPWPLPIDVSLFGPSPAVITPEPGQPLKLIIPMNVTLENIQRRSPYLHLYALTFADGPRKKRMPVRLGLASSEPTSSVWITHPEFENRYLPLTLSFEGDNQARSGDNHYLKSSKHPQTVNRHYYTDSNNLRPEHIQIHHMHKAWRIFYHGQLIKKINTGVSEPNILTLTLQPGHGQSGTSYLALPMDFRGLHLLSTRRAKAPFVLRRKGIKIKLEPIDNNGYMPDSLLPGFLTTRALGRYEGIYFADGLKSLEAVRQSLAGRVSTRAQTVHRKVATPDQGTYIQTLLEGNGLNNIIRGRIADSQYNSRYQYGYMVRGHDGIDFIQLLQTGSNATRPLSYLSDESAASEFVNKQQVLVDGGKGDDILDLSDNVKVTLKGSPGKDTVFVSRHSRADLFQARHHRLYLRGLLADQVQPVFLNNIRDDDNSVTFRRVDALKDASDIFLKTEDTPSASGRLKNFFVRLSPWSLSEIRFADGQRITDIEAWLTNPATEGVNRGENHAESTPSPRPAAQSTIVATPVNGTTGVQPSFDPMLSEEDRQVIDYLNSARLYARRSQRNETESTEMEHSLHNLIQEMARFNGIKDVTASTNPSARNSTVIPTLASSSLRQSNATASIPS